MNLPDIKQLKKLADACRKAGIKHFKSPEFEFTLTDDAPVKQTRSAKGAAPTHHDDGAIETSELTPQEMLFWSVGDVPSGLETKEEAN